MTKEELLKKVEELEKKVEANSEEIIQIERSYEKGIRKSEARLCHLDTENCLLMDQIARIMIKVREINGH